LQQTPGSILQSSDTPEKDNSNISNLILTGSLIFDIDSLFL
jgi:hypothetical protein